MSSEEGAHCTNFTVDDYYNESTRYHYRCPGCKGFLPDDFPTRSGDQFQCKKCGAVLEIIRDPPDEDELETWKDSFEDGIVYQLGLEPIPEYDEEDQEESGYFTGRICIVPENLINIKVRDYKALRAARPAKKRATDLRVIGYNFTRRVWRDRDGYFFDAEHGRVNIDPTKTEVTLLKTINDTKILEMNLKIVKDPPKPSAESAALNELINDEEAI